MTVNDPIVVGAASGGAAAAAWVIRTWIIRQDKRVLTVESRIAALETRMAAHDAGNALIQQMNNELQELIKLTNRIAGHLKID